jgi:hypothetical protein
VLIVDEVSMLDGDLFDKLEEIARNVRHNTKPFGGLQLILSGEAVVSCRVCRVVSCHLPQSPSVSTLLMFALSVRADRRGLLPAASRRPG